MNIGDRIYEKYFDQYYPYEIVEIIDNEHIIVRSCVKKRVDGEIRYVIEDYKPEYLTEEILSNITFKKNLYFNYPNILQKINNKEIKIGDIYDDNNINLENIDGKWIQRYKNNKLGKEIFYFNV